MYVVANQTLACLPAATAVELNELVIVSECPNHAYIHVSCNGIITVCINVDTVPFLYVRVASMSHDR